MSDAEGRGSPEVTRRDIQEHFRRAQRLAEGLYEENASLKAQLSLGPQPTAGTGTERLAEAERELDRLANLYIAAAQLHTCLAVEDTLRAMAEIIINLVGARSFCIYVSNGAGAPFVPVFSEGLDIAQRAQRAADDAELKAAIDTEVVTLHEQPFEGPAAIVPLMVERETAGAIVIDSLLEQKESFEELDRELLEMLRAQAGNALVASAMFEQAAQGQRFATADAITKIIGQGPQA